MDENFIESVAKWSLLIISAESAVASIIDTVLSCCCYISPEDLGLLLLISLILQAQYFSNEKLQHHPSKKITIFLVSSVLKRSAAQHQNIDFHSYQENKNNNASALVLFFPQAVLIFGLFARKTCY